MGTLRQRALLCLCFISADAGGEDCWQAQACGGD